MATLEELVKKKFNERWTTRKEVILNGDVADWSEYRYTVGYIKGMYDLMADISPLIRDPDEAGDFDGR